MLARGARRDAAADVVAQVAFAQNYSRLSDRNPSPVIDGPFTTLPFAVLRKNLRWVSTASLSGRFCTVISTIVVAAARTKQSARAEPEFRTRP